MDPLLELLSSLEMPPGTKVWADPRDQSFSVTPALPNEMESGPISIHEFLDRLQEELRKHGWVIQNPVVVNDKEIIGKLLRIDPE